MCHGFKVDSAAQFEEWESIEPYIPHLKPVHMDDVATVQFFTEAITRTLAPDDMEYFVQGEWKSFREVMNDGL